jgi:hypothetical protein
MSIDKLVSMLREAGLPASMDRVGTVWVSSTEPEGSVFGISEAEGDDSWLLIRYLDGNPEDEGTVIGENFPAAEVVEYLS